MPIAGAGMILALISLATGTVAEVRAAGSCSDSAVAGAVDKIGSSIRRREKKSRTVFRPKLEKLAKIKNVSVPEAESWLWLNLKNPKITELDQKIDRTIGEMDRVSNAEDRSKNCQTIEKLQAIETDFNALMQTRFDLALQELDQHIATAENKRAAPQNKDTATRKKAENKKPTPTVARATEKDTPAQWTADVRPDDVAVGPPPPVAYVPPQAQDAGPLPDGVPQPGARQTFSVAEISKAGSGVFGNVSSHIAAAINGAFSKFGQPNAYVTGTEGGGAFLAGLRYGKGKIHLADGTEHKVYWNGPSLGYDLGADGSRVMFLIYNLRAVDQLFARYPGVAGMAFLAGGVGVTVLGRGGTTIVPIRAGVGLRLGANLSYLRFSPKRRWNPF